MQSASFPARQARTGYRHPVWSLTYVTLDGANGGIVRNLSHEGIAVQAVAALRQEQRVRLRFELRSPRVRVEARGEVTWANSARQCGIRFVDLPGRTRQQIDEWVFSNLLDLLSREETDPRTMFRPSSISSASSGDDGLILSSSSRPAIRLASFSDMADHTTVLPHRVEEPGDPDPRWSEINWLSRPLSVRTLAWMVDGLVPVAGLLLFTLIFLAIAHEVPQWPLTVGGVLAGSISVLATYYALFAIFGGPSLGTRLARNTQAVVCEAEDNADRFR
jgi:hypothetical protein